MTMTFQDYYITKINTIVLTESAKKTDLIFVILAQNSLWTEHFPTDAFADTSTLKTESDHTVFDKKWYRRILSALKCKKPFHIISYAQFYYLKYYANDLPPFTDRIMIIEDNLRQLFPITSTEFLEETAEENIEQRPANLPFHQIEQMVIHGQYYYSVNRPMDNFNIFPMFEEAAEIQPSEHGDLPVIDLASDPFALDILINTCIAEQDFHRSMAIKYYDKQLIDKRTLTNLQRWNAVLKQFGGELFLGKMDQISDKLPVQEETQALLKKYWGKDATFRKLAIYKNPDQGNEVIEISQGLIVETIIAEYKNAKLNSGNRDIFLTAPTGSGKSLIFQLPAYYVSAQNDVSIVVSPLIALMKDQVQGILSERQFEKVAYLNGELSLIDREKVIDRCKNGEIDILYMSPELLLSYDLSYFIDQRTLGLLIVDEAHLITTWGRDFRVDYWFLGEHVRKLRKHHNLHFTMVAVTATSIYGGTNDMVFDSMASLNMQSPHMFIGQVKRDDITFAVHNYNGFESKYEANKLQQTVSFITEAHDLGLKTLVYTPYTRHISKIMEALNSRKLDIATGYHGGMAAEIKEFAFRQFKSGKKNIMISTKAFGMGIDIADIELVYHHAPSGLLPDYIQEIGRVARQTDITGLAAINYAPEDLRYAKALNYMSAIRPQQIQDVLQKIHLSYLRNDKNRNLILSTDDFEYIFEQGQDIQQKVLTTLMMIEKDYLAKYRFPVVTARPKKLSVQGYAKVSAQDLVNLENFYPNTHRSISIRKNGEHIVALDLDKIWKQYFSKQSFDALKNTFYTGTLFKQDNITLTPQIKITFVQTDSFTAISYKIRRTFDAIEQVFSLLTGYFTQYEFEQQLGKKITDKEIVKKISHLLFTAYMTAAFGQKTYLPHIFLQRRKVGGEDKYIALTNPCSNTFTGLTNRLQSLFGNTEKRTVSRFLTSKRANSDSYVRLGNFLEILGLATFEIKGGSNTLVAIRLNDPARLEIDTHHAEYKNTLLDKTLERHELNMRLFDHFFLNDFSHNDRWRFIEDYFLGMEVDALFGKYPTSDRNNVDLKDQLEKLILSNEGTVKKKGTEPEEEAEIVPQTDTNLHIFSATKDSVLTQSKLLTIETEDEVRTMRISEWLMNDPVALDKNRRAIDFKLDIKTYGILVSKLKAYHFEYYRGTLRLQLVIQFKGYNTPLKAIIPYTDHPVEFYMWWCENPEQITMSFKEKIILFDHVNRKKPKALKSEHKKVISGK
ncbi:hypothetical protein C4F40_04445 [Sphingobacterium sp. Ka21]|uniref:DNA 3'-5' helicase n=2 Tax=Sphingobacterium pedocola TaxID=2082722 RepID=A0ABR9T3W7_9SPHI|nr:hypothetical protein [Sphingobacterium pedocola]